MMAKVGLIVLTCFLLLGGCSQGGSSALPDIGGYGSRNGAKEAKQDIRRDAPSLKAYGLPHHATERYAKLLKERLGVEFDPIAGCSVTANLIKYANSYNSVTQEYIAKRFGPHALEELWKQAVEEEESSH